MNSNHVTPITSKAMKDMRCRQGTSVFEAHSMLRRQSIFEGLEELKRRQPDPDSDMAILIDILELMNDPGPRG